MQFFKQVNKQKRKKWKFFKYQLKHIEIKTLKEKDLFFFKYKMIITEILFEILYFMEKSLKDICIIFYMVPNFVYFILYDQLF